MRGRYLGEKTSLNIEYLESRILESVPKLQRKRFLQVMAPSQRETFSAVVFDTGALEKHNLSLKLSIEQIDRFERCF